MRDYEDPQRFATKIRSRLGRLWGLERALTMYELAAVMRLAPKSGHETVRSWERRGNITGPAVVAIELMLAGAGSAELIKADSRRMGPSDIRDARYRLGMAWGQRRPLTPGELASALRFDPENGADVIMQYEAGERPIGGPMSLALDLMLAGRVPAHLAEGPATASPAAAQPARADQFPGASRPAQPLTGRGGTPPATVT